MCAGPDIELCLSKERRRVSDATPASPIAAIGVLSLGLLLPIGAGPLTDKAVALLTSSVEGPTKTVTFVRNGQPEALRTRAATVADLFREQYIERTPEDALDVDPSSAVTDGETIHFRAAAPVTLVVDDIPQTVRTTAETVGAMLAGEHVTYDSHDKISPAPATAVASEQTIHVDHVNSWVETVRRTVPPPVKHLMSWNLALGHVKVMQNGAPGLRETSYLVTRDDANRSQVTRATLASRVLRQPRVRVVAAGIGEYSALADLAKRGFDGTINLARAAISMVATAYTANCYGCSGMTAIRPARRPRHRGGRSAGHPARFAPLHPGLRPRRRGRHRRRDPRQPRRPRLQLRLRRNAIRPPERNCLRITPVDKVRS